jgi:leader peptidase (prepilin peptidase)/N-methyltransferase
MNHLPYIIWFFVLGSCIGSFLNVVIWRLPREMSLVSPGSHCPKCERPLAWYDNIPILGWIKLLGRCRYCGQPISIIYPIVETATACLFALFYVLFFMYNVGPCGPMAGERLSLVQDWPIFSLYLYVLCALLASSLIDLESFTIISRMFYWMAGIGIVFHAVVDNDAMPGSLSVIHPAAAALAAGGGVGLILSVGLYVLGVMPQSFPLGEPLMEIDREEWEKEIARAKSRGEKPPELPPNYTRGQIRAEISKEMLFLLPPLILAGAWVWLTILGHPAGQWWTGLMAHAWLRGALGSVLGALIGGGLIWLTRIAGTLGFGRISMGLGDADLLFGVGAVLGCGRIVLTFFIAPFFGLAVAIYMILTSKRREIPYGPYLSLAAAFLMLFYCPIADHLRPGMIGFMQALRDSWANHP